MECSAEHFSTMYVGRQMEAPIWVACARGCPGDIFTTVALSTKKVALDVATSLGFCVLGPVQNQAGGCCSKFRCHDNRSHRVVSLMGFVQGEMSRFAWLDACNDYSPHARRPRTDPVRRHCSPDSSLEARVRKKLGRSIDQVLPTLHFPHSCDMRV